MWRRATRSAASAARVAAPARTSTMRSRSEGSRWIRAASSGSSSCPGMAAPFRACHPRPMPDTLFGDEHVRQYEATGGKVGHDWNGAQTLILHTTGRRSGQTRKHPLIYGRDDGNYLVVASRGGAPDHPDWYK